MTLNFFRMKKLLIFFAIGVAITLSACTAGSNADEHSDPAAVMDQPPGKVVFTKNCRLCHGNDGTLGLSGAANLSITVLNLEEIKTVVTNGRKGMPSWKDKLTPEQIQQVAEYVLTLKK